VKDPAFPWLEDIRDLTGPAWCGTGNKYKQQGGDQTCRHRFSPPQTLTEGALHARHWKNVMQDQSDKNTSDLTKQPNFTSSSPNYTHHREELFQEREKG
jgi:hypothetical protein